MDKSGESEGLKNQIEPGEKNREPAAETRDEATGRDPASSSNSYDELKSNFYEAASRILGRTAEELSKTKPSELAQQLSPKLEEFEGIKSAYEFAKPFVDILAQPANLINPTEFAKTLAEERPNVYGKLAEDLVVVHMPDYLGAAVNNYSRYDADDREAIDTAVENHMVARVRQLTGLPVTGDQFAEAIGNYVRAIRAGQNPQDLYGQHQWRSGTTSGFGGARNDGTVSGYPGASAPRTPALTGATAEEIANQLGVDAGDPAVRAAWNMMQQQSSQLARQFGTQIQALQGKLAMLEQGQKQTTQTLLQRREQESIERLKGEMERAKEEQIGKLRVPKGYEDELDFIRAAVENRVSESPALQSLQDQIRGWYMEGNPQRAAGLIGRYTNRLGQIVAEVSGPRLQRIEAYEKTRAREVENQGKRRELPAGGSQVRPGGRATNGRQFKNEDEAAEAIVGQAMEWLRAKGKVEG
jgi:hypothetical protein